jgi:hypothetical protein
LRRTATKGGRRHLVVKRIIERILLLLQHYAADLRIKISAMTRSGI